jgi:hypothetical protein
MKTQIITVVAMALTCMLTSCAHTKHVLVEFRGPTACIKSVGKADPHVVSGFFHPQVWIGPFPWDQIPTQASPCGVLIITRGRKTKALPLLAWSTTNSVPQFGCNGPTQDFILREDSQRKLFDGIRNRITGKANKPNGE